MLIVFYIILGMFVDDFSMLAITLPITHPLMIALGFDPVWFGVIAVILVGVATITPPFGIAVFAAKGLVGEQATLWSIFMGALPFIIAMLVVIVILTIWPQIALFLPSLMIK
jgi:TRAP-type C4-dicarboxylate transport system permease large subunit